MSNTEDSDSVLCSKCVEGFVLPGTPVGEEVTIGPYKTYVSSPSTSNNKGAAIVFLTDVFGLGLTNNKIIPDKIAKQLDVTVYVPDVFHGGYPSDSFLNGQPTTAEESRKVGILRKLKTATKIAPIVPWFLTHMPKTTFPETAEFIKVLKTERGHTALGCVGYCYGGKTLVHFNALGEFEAAVACHPSLLKLPEIETIKVPTLFALAEEDSQFSPEMRTKAEEALKTKDFEAPIKVYANTTHGFACRPDLSQPDVKKGFEQSLADTIAFFKKHLKLQDGSSAVTAPAAEEIAPPAAAAASAAPEATSS